MHNIIISLVLITSTPPVTYRIDARLTPRTDCITGSMTLTFRNQSSGPINSIHFYLYPNAFRDRTTVAEELARKGDFSSLRRLKKQPGSITIENVTADSLPLRYSTQEAVLTVFLSHPLPPKDSVSLRIAFTTRIPALVNNLGRKGSCFILSRWYPQVAAFDEAGWRLPLAPITDFPPGAFANYHITLMAPAGYIVAGGGQLLALPGSAYRFRAENQTDFAFIARPNLVQFSDTTTFPKIRLFLSPKSAPRVREILAQVRTGILFFTRWFGNCPFPELTIVDATGIASGDLGAPGLIILTQPTVPFTRLAERQLITAIARQFFAFNPASDETENPLLAWGIAGYATNRYLETVYGENNLLDLPFYLPCIAGLSDRYLHQLIYYIAATNGRYQPLTAASRSPLIFTTERPEKSAAVLTLRTVEKEIGTARIDSAIRHYLTTNRNRYPATPALLAAITAAAGPEKEVIINRLFAQEASTDIAITGIRQKKETTVITLRHRDLPDIPLTIKTRFADGSFRIDTITGADSTISFPATKRVRQVLADPEGKLLETNRWNNAFPRQVTFQPVFSLPSFSSYQVFYGPWFWYDNYRGFQPGVWLQGRKFVDAGPIRGEHNWTIIGNYASHKSDWHTGVSYQTPLIFFPFRSRLYFSGDNSFRDRGARLYLLSDFGTPFQPPRAEIDFGYRLYELIDTTGRDPRAWEKARTAELRTRLCHYHHTTLFLLRQELQFSQGLPALLSQFRYSRISLEENCRLFLPVMPSVAIRLFIGAIAGTTPPQEKFYLSGGLSYTNAEPVSWAYQGMASGQEHWHYDGDANCRGYYGLYRHGRYAYGINIHIFSDKPIQPFLDVGNVADSLTHPGFFSPVLDAGIRLKLGPLYADFPIWKSHPEQNERHLAFRWSLGFKLNDLVGGS